MRPALPPGYKKAAAAGKLRRRGEFYLSALPSGKTTVMQVPLPS